VVTGSTDPVFNEKKEFHVPTVKGFLHLALYHVAKKDVQFIGELTVCEHAHARGDGVLALGSC
jgi:hypothetical protein